MILHTETIEGQTQMPPRSNPLDNIGAWGFGGAAIGNLYRPVSEADAFETVRAAFDAGVRYFDTAPHYGFGLSEKRLGSALASIDPRHVRLYERHGDSFFQTTVQARADSAAKAVACGEPVEIEGEIAHGC